MRTCRRRPFAAEPTRCFSAGASGRRRVRVRLRAGQSARLAADRAPAGRQSDGSGVAGDSLLNSAAHPRAACRGGGTATRTMVDNLTKGERPLMQMKLKIIWNL